MAPESARRTTWIERRRLRYKRHPIVPFSDVRDSLKTGDIILFHKTIRHGFLDSLELDFVSPVLFRENEFRHVGVIVAHEGELFVLECAEQRHSGYGEARYPTGGNGIRIVSLEALLNAYTRDNGDPHYGVRFISREIPSQQIFDVLGGYGRVDYLKMHLSVPLMLTRFLPSRMQRRFLAPFDGTMMCSEFVHHILNRCGALADYPSKLLAPYLLEDDDFFGKLAVVPFSGITRFSFPLASSDAR